MHSNPRIFIQAFSLLFLSFILICIFLSIPMRTPLNFQWPADSILTNPSQPITPLNFPTNPQDEQTSLDQNSIWCLNMAHRLDMESFLPHSPVLRLPSFNSSKLNRLPYHYSQWKSSSILPRGFTPCEHHLAMRLLMIIERICRKHHITFMLADGSFLGSWRHHDIIPWDDDIDVMISQKQRNHFINLMNKLNKTSVKFDRFTYGGKEGEYYKISWKNTPSAGSLWWNFPFVDIFVYERNESHLWQMTDPNRKIEVRDIFPLVMRPFGELWLPAPRNAEKYFSFDPYDQCQGSNYNHRKETTANGITVKCDDLKEIYPFVQRNNQSNSDETLILNQTILHTIVHN